MWSTRIAWWPTYVRRILRGAQAGVQVISKIQKEQGVPKRMTAKLVRAFADQSWAHQNFSPNGRLHLICSQCRSLVILFENLMPTDRSQIASLRRSGYREGDSDAQKRLRV